MIVDYISPLLNPLSTSWTNVETCGIYLRLFSVKPQAVNSDMVLQLAAWATVSAISPGPLSLSYLPKCTRRLTIGVEICTSVQSELGSGRRRRY